jgi:predicted amidophosphoribosyltransferase
MFCKHCGQKLNDNDLFCSTCGAEVSNNQESFPPVVVVDEPKKPLTNLEKQVIWISLIAVMLTLFPFHDVIIIGGTIVGIIACLFAGIARFKQNSAVMPMMMILSITAVLIQASWFAFFNIML